LQDFYFNIHSHRKKQQNDEFVIRNYIIPKAKTPAETLNYPLSVGIHPWYADTQDLRSIQHLKKQASAKNVIAIGETGLDKKRRDNFEEQVALFRIHFTIAEENQLPVIIHCVKAYSDVIAEIKNTKTPVIFHDFNGNEQMIEQILKHSKAYFSLGKSLFATDSKIVKSIHYIPIERIFFETDTLPVKIKTVYEKYAVLAKTDLKELKTIIQNNFNQVFTMKMDNHLF
jgi:TatD DNase family protein